jgi:hypothetical protein
MRFTVLLATTMLAFAGCKSKTDGGGDKASVQPPSEAPAKAAGDPAKPAEGDSASARPEERCTIPAATREADCDQACKNLEIQSGGQPDPACKSTCLEAPEDDASWACSVQYSDMKEHMDCFERCGAKKKS